MESNKQQYIIVDINKQLFFKDVEGKTMIFNDLEMAQQYCWIHELENAWVCEMLHNYIDK